MPNLSIAVDRARLRQSLAAIVGERSPFSSLRHLGEVEDFVENELRSFGLVVESDFFPNAGQRYRNIVGRLGRSQEPPIVIGAHIDAVEGTPGADDNASGVAVLLEAARVLSQANLTSPITFCAFNLEELNMIGSSTFARKLKAAEQNIVAMISLEMVGYTDARPGSQKLPAGLGRFYPDRGNFIGIVGNWKSNAVLRRFAAGMRRVSGLPVETLSVPGKGMVIPAVRLSDHSPFWDLGFPALLVTDTSFYRNPHYHGPTDTIETLDIDFMAKTCEGVIRALLALLKDPDAIR